MHVKYGLYIAQEHAPRVKCLQCNRLSLLVVNNKLLHISSVRFKEKPSCFVPGYTTENAQEIQQSFYQYKSIQISNI